MLKAMFSLTVNLALQHREPTPAQRTHCTVSARQVITNIYQSIWSNSSCGNKRCLLSYHLVASSLKYCRTQFQRYITTCSKEIDGKNFGDSSPPYSQSFYCQSYFIRMCFLHNGINIILIGYCIYVIKCYPLGTCEKARPVLT